MPNTHSDVVGSSTATRVHQCPGSIQVMRNAPPRQSSVYADEGTALHWLMEQVLKDDLDPDSFINETYGEIVFTQKLLDECIYPAYYRVQELLAAYLPTVHAAWELEVTLPFPDIDGAYGTGDLVGVDLGISPTTCLIVDYKFGAGVPVYVNETKQGLFLACGARHAYGLRGRVERYAFSIIQPRGALTNMGGVMEYSDAQLDVFEDELQERVANGLGPDPRYRKGSWCKWCSKGTCPEYRRQLADLSNRLAARRNTDGAPKPLAKGELLNTSWDDADWANLVRRVAPWTSLLRTLLKEIDEEALAMAAQGERFPGLKLVEAVGNTTWAYDDPDATISELVAYFKKFGAQYRADDIRKLFFTAPKLVTAPEAKKIAKKHQMPFPEKLTHRPSRGVALVAESDKRPAIQASDDQVAKVARMLAAKQTDNE